MTTLSEIAVRFSRASLESATCINHPEAELPRNLKFSGPLNTTRAALEFWPYPVNEQMRKRLLRTRNRDHRDAHALDPAEVTNWVPLQWRRARYTSHAEFSESANEAHF